MLESIVKTNVGKVYFVDASANTFEHVLAYLRRGVASWPDLADDPKFYQRLVAGAEYFGLGGSHAGRIVEFCTHCATFRKRHPFLPWNVEAEK